MTSAPLFLPPAQADPGDGKCTSLKETRLHKDGVTVYVRCEASFGHPGKNHRSWIRKWKTDEESGRLS